MAYVVIFTGGLLIVGNFVGVLVGLLVGLGITFGNGWVFDKYVEVWIEKRRARLVFVNIAAFA